MLRIFLTFIFCWMLALPSMASQKNISPVDAHADVREIPIGERNQRLGAAFLEENSKKPGVHMLPSGLQYKILQEGSGTYPTPTDFVTVNYRGTLIDGTEFDSSYNHHAPGTFAMNAVIPGWREALEHMQPGAKWTIYVPPNLAYGKKGAGRLIGPHATLIFDVELISIKPSLSTDSEEFNMDLDEEG